MNIKRTKSIYNEETKSYYTIEFQLTEEQYKIEQQILLNHEVSQIRAKRDECFRIVNRGQVWYNTLNEEQKNELQLWYEAWLDAPETKNIPIIPKWIK